MANNVDYLVDSDVWVAFFLPDDALALTVEYRFHELEVRQQRLGVTNWVIAEVATVLSYKDTHATALKFLDMIEESDLPILTISPILEHETQRIFREQTTKKTSMVDCSNVAVAQHYAIPHLFTFDRFYQRFGYTVEKLP